ncbi:MAG: hypothetical protein J5476_14155 [Lachnospiraceae bacterium]|nr:hypothetical protein [Lachnospiraceae bacterium]
MKKSVVNKVLSLSLILTLFASICGCGAAKIFPIEVSEPILENQFPAEYELKVNESRTGTLVFEAPEGSKDFGVGFVEYYEDATEGNGFWVYFTAEEK